VPRKATSTLAALAAAAALFAAVPAAHAETRTFSNATPISIPDRAPASPYPDAIQVSGMSGVVAKAKVTIAGFTHPSAYDVNIVLQAPNGRSTILMGARCTKLTNATFAFDDFALTQIPPQGNTCIDGEYKPGYSSVRGTALIPPAPQGPYNQSLAFLDGQTPNGSWKLFVDDELVGGDGTIAGGWSLTVDAQPKTLKKCRKGKKRSKKTGKCVKKKAGRKKGSGK
jgi:subtilisin-like proprotein convertase family protein